jgi:uncharacterized protein
MKLGNINRRKFLAALGVALFGTPLCITAEAKWLEPTWLSIRRLKIGDGAPSHRLVHFSDLHHKGDRSYLQSVVDAINSLAPDFVCFTGDIVEDRKFLKEALQALSQIRSPIFGVPGNHDFWSGIPFGPVRECLASTGGAWLLDEARPTADGRINIIGATCFRPNQALQPVDPAAKRILLFHYPAWVKRLGGQKFDLLLAGHSHGGQVRIPFHGPIFLPSGVDEYDLGLFQTRAGPLYVNAGIGYLQDYNFRFNCRPEITLIEI